MGRLVARIFGVLAIGLGVGILVWGIMVINTGDPLRVPEFLGDGLVQTASEVVGCGAGILAAGLATLFLTFVGQQRPDEWDE